MMRRLAIAVVLCGVVHAQDDALTFVPLVAREAAGEGDAAFAKGDYKAAGAAYRKVLDLAPGNLLALVNLGLIEFRLGDSEKAEKLLRQAVSQRLETGPAWLTLGMIYFQQGRIEPAFAALSQAVVYDEGNARAHNYLGAVLGRKGWLDGAEAELRRAVEIDPVYKDAHYNLAFVYMQEKPPSLELARRHYFKSIELGGQPDKDLEKKLSDAQRAQQQ